MHIEIWSDVFCPFCYIGKRTFERALADFPKRDAVTVTWMSFQLAPDDPVDSDETLSERLARKYGTSVEQAVQMQAGVAARGAEVGLRLDLEHARVTNSFDAHRLIHLAREHGLQDAAEERFFRAYFSEAVHVGHRDTLIALAREIGLPEREAIAVLDSDRYADAVAADIRVGISLGLQGVPFFVLDRRYAVSGAQSPDVFAAVLARAWAEANGHKRE